MRRRIALILPDWMEYTQRIAEGAASYAVGHGGVELFDRPYHRNAGDPMQGQPIDFEGAVVWSLAKDPWVKGLIKAGVEVVSANGIWPVDEVPRVNVDRLASMEIAIRHLSELQPTKVVYAGWVISGLPAHRLFVDRFLSRFESLGIETDFFETGPFKECWDPAAVVPREVLNKLANFLRKLPKGSAMWCQFDLVARLVCDVASSQGLEIPGDLAILGTGDLRAAKFGRPGISTIAMPGQVVGSRAVKMVDALITGKRLESRAVSLSPPPVVVRETTSPVESHSIIATARQWIGRHACDGATVNELMEVVPVSQRTLSAMFTEQIGRTPGQEIRRVRIIKAMQSLRSTDLTISRVAQLCGYNQPAKFSNFFKRETGIMPSEYRSGRPSVKRPIPIMGLKKDR